MPIVSDYTALLYSQTWNGNLPASNGQPFILTYSFSTQAQPYLSAAGYSQAFIDSFVPFTDKEKSEARNAIGQWDAASGLRLVEVAPGLGSMQLGNFNLALGPTGNAAGFAVAPTQQIYPESLTSYSKAVIGDVFISSSIVESGLNYLMLHEIGHALGLKHPFEDPVRLETNLDNRTQTVMSYTGTVLVDHRLGPLDIQAIQYLYGTNTNDASNVSSWNWNAATAMLTLIGKAGADRLIGNYSADSIEGLSGDDLIFGDFGDDILSGGDGVDTIMGGDGADLVLGGPGNDRLGGGPGRDTVRGGAGDDDLFGNSLYAYPRETLDTVDYSDARASLSVNLTTYITQLAGRDIHAQGADIGNDYLEDFTHVIAGSGNDGVTGNADDNFLQGRAGADTLNGRAGNDILLGDGAVMPTSGALSIYRLYLATLGRAPDDAGWAEWSGRLAGGQPLNTISSGFVGSQEFLARYGNPDNVGFVNLLYQNVLGRTPDSAGLQNWLGAFNGGMSRNQMVVEFSESAELKANADPSTQAGQIYRIYGATLARVPDNTGFTSWSDLMAGGRSIDSVAAGFVGSTEFQSVYGPLNNTQFVTLLYQNVLSRAPDAVGLAGWKAKLDNGESRTSVVLGFSDSGEYTIAKNAAFVSYMKTVYAGFNDSLDGSAGDDLLSGGLGADTFAFSSSEVGSDIVHRFEAWDTVRLIGFGYATKAVALAKVTQQGADAVFSDKGESITFVNTTLSTLQQADWLLV
jgi:Ca2+-binding RTX toxin-like protein